MLRTCVTCQVEYQSKPSKRRVYCSRKCYHGPRLEVVMMPCVRCGKMYKGRPFKNSKYRSRRCFFEAQRRAVAVQCGHCAKEMVRPLSASSGIRFCSYACRAYALSVGKTIGIKLHHDSPPKPYGRSYWVRQASRARKRDGYQCQDCGKQFVKGARLLAVHHIIPIRLNGSDHLSNLLSLCGKCHRKADAAIQAQELRDWPVGVPRPKHIRHAPLPNHCKNGHEYTPENTLSRNDNNGRRCRICDNASHKRRYHERRDASQMSLLPAA